MVVGVASHVPPTALQKQAASPALHCGVERETGKPNRFNNSKEAIKAERGMITSDCRRQQPVDSLFIA